MAAITLFFDEAEMRQLAESIEDKAEPEEIWGPTWELFAAVAGARLTERIPEYGVEVARRGPERTGPLAGFALNKDKATSAVLDHLSDAHVIARGAYVYAFQAIKRERAAQA